MIGVHDLHSKWPEVATTSVVTSTTVIHTLQELFTRWGIPEVIIIDNGPQFTSFQFNEFLQHFGIKHRNTALYNPPSNGGIERFNRVMKEGVKASMAEGKTFPNAVRTTLCNYRATRHTLTDISPAELMIGRKLTPPLDALRKPQPPTPTKRAEIIAEKQKATKAYTGQKRRAKPPRLDNGDWVRVKRPHRGHKMKPSLSASLRITKHVGPLPFNSRMVILGMHAG